MGFWKQGLREGGDRLAQRDWTLVEEAWLRYHFVFFEVSRLHDGIAITSGPPHRTLPLHHAETEVDDGFFRPPSLQRFDHHGGGVAAHLVAVGAHAGQRRHAG